MHKRTQAILQSAIATVEAGIEVDSYDQYEAVRFCRDVGCLVALGSVTLPTKEELEDRLVMCLVSLERLSKNEKFNKAVERFNKNRAPGSEPLRGRWWYYGALGSPESLRKYIPKKERVGKLLNTILDKAKSREAV